jgi:preprotein translocase subunit Sss1
MSEEEYKEKSKAHEIIMFILFVIGFAMLLIVGACIFAIPFFILYINLLVRCFGG